jgi:hypothetical protein
VKSELKNVFDAAACDLELPVIDPLNSLNDSPAFNRLNVLNGLNYLNPSSELLLLPTPLSI